MKLYKPRNPETREQTLPLVNIVFLLLIFFMLAGKLAEPDVFDISPPESVSEIAPEKQSVTVSIASDGRLAIEGNELLLDDIQAYITQLGHSSDGLGVRLKADGMVNAQRVIEVMDTLRNTGVEKVWMLTTPGET